MNVRFFSVPAKSRPAEAVASAAQPANVRHLRRERDFGVGYGSSSGYASYRRYSNAGFQPLFRCA